jgi:RNase P subunit RPR2
MAPPPDAAIIYCAYCRSNTPSRNVEYIVMRSGRPATIAVCTQCGTKKFHQGVPR